MVQQGSVIRTDQPADATVTVSLGKGAWDCDKRAAIPPEKEAEVFEEIATMDFPFEGIPTVPPRKDMDHMVFFCSGCRYRVTAYRDWTVARVKQALWDGGIQRSNKPESVRNTPGLHRWQDLTLSYAGQHMEDDKRLMEYHVPPGCQALIAIETAKLSTKPDRESAYWN
ncbi:hypothetical protein WJX81_005455 [Elliptochloris bilobata]|uniref:Ubiquitin-like domain-containing protein n=1 Tax=Elliptochloris bilobata TaxID=381761 RepID=A0AAW1RZP4_9CHLO